MLLPSTRLDPDGGAHEARVVRSAGLERVYAEHSWTIYRLLDPTPLVTGPGAVRIKSFGHTTIAGSATRPVRYLLRAHYIPFWRTSPNVCVARAPNGLTWLYVLRLASFSLKVASAGDGLLLAAGSGRSRCV